MTRRSHPGRFGARIAGGLAALLLPAFAAHAVPLLQLYVEGSTYDDEHESWVFDATAGEAFNLWVIGNVSGPGGAGTISDVKLSVVYPDPVAADGGSLSLSLTPSTTGGFGGFTDPSTPAAPTFEQVNEDGDAPKLSDGRSLPSHGVYGDGAEWQEFLLGDFTLSDSPVADFIDDFPGPADMTADAGQINVYEVVVTAPGLQIDSIDLHFDAYDNVVAGNHSRAVFAPFSHDAGTGINEPVPEPGVLVLTALGLLALAAARGRRRT